MRSRPPTRSRNRADGIALLAVLWGVMLLSVVALIFSNLIQIEVRTAAYQKEAARAYAFACGGVNAAIFQMAYMAQQGSDANSPDVWRHGQRELTIHFNDGAARLLILSETGKLDLNMASEDQLDRLFEARGLNPPAAAELAHALIHWRSPLNPDDRDAAALDDYYRALNRGDLPRHARFVSVEEALQVRGMTPDIFYGTVTVTEEGKIRSNYGVGQDLTIYSRTGQVNVNFASEQVLESVPGIDPEWARAVIRERQQAPFGTLDDIGRRLPLTVPDEALPFLSTGEGDTYSIIAVGRVAGSNVHRAVRAVVRFPVTGSDRYQVLEWHDDESSAVGLG